MSTTRPGTRAEAMRLSRIIGSSRHMALAAFALSAATIVGGTGTYLMVDRQRVAAATEERLADDAALAAQHLDRGVQAVDILVRQYVEEFARFDGPAEAFAAAVSARLERAVGALPQISTYSIIDAAGRVVASRNRASLGIDVSDRAYFRAQREGDAGFYLSDPVLGRPNRERLLPISWRLSAADGGFGGVISVSLSAAYFGDFIATLTTELRQTGVFARPDGTVLMITPAPADPEAPLPAIDAAPAVADAPAGTIRLAEPALGGTWVFGHRMSDLLPVRALVGAREADALAAWRRRAFGLAAAAAALVGLFGFLTHLTLRGARREVAARREAEAANRAKDDFLAAVSHEIRTPMNAVLGMAQLLARQPIPPEARGHVNTIRAAGETLLALLNDILDAARLEANKLELDPAPFNLHRLIDEAVELFRAGAAERGLRLEADVPADSPPVVMGDAVRLRQVLFNLVGNAVKFTHRGHVVVRLRHRLAGEGRVQLRIEVEDTGIGIPADQQRRLFQPFTQADAQVSARYGGTGLGLSICRRIVALMGGEIGVESEPGAGSTFQVKLTLPLASLAAAPAEAEAEPAAPLRILAVDDNPANRMLAVAMLSASGHAVEQADSGAAALAAVQDGRFDVVLMDVQMPGMDGVEATRRIRALPPPVGGVPIVALTANAFASQRAAYMEAGMNDCVTKPVDWAVLNAVLLRLVPKPRAREPVLDLEHLRGLERVIGRDRLRELADAFAAECGRLFAELEGQRGDLPVLRRTGHVVKGAAANFGALRLVALATAMEEAKDAESAMPASAALEAALREAMAAFEQAFPAGPAAAP